MYVCTYVSMYVCADYAFLQVLAVFEEIHVDKVLHILVFGESLLNGVCVYLSCQSTCIGMHVLPLLESKCVSAVFCVWTLVRL